MDQSNSGSKRDHPGGIISLAQFSEEHAGALNYDLMTRTHYQIDDVGGALSWSSLYSFVTHLGGDSALARDLDKATGWEDTQKTNEILADIFDLLQVINANIVAFASGGHKKTKVTPYPRPGREADKNERRLGTGGLKLEDLREWIRRKRENGRR